MLKQASIAQVKNREIPRSGSHIVIAMRFYPRFLKKELRDEFVCHLAPEKELLKDFNEAQRSLRDHNSAFAHVDYNRRFELSASGRANLERLSLLSFQRDVYLACICAMGERCHREILMLAGAKLYGCPIGEVFHDYPEYMEKL